MNTKKAMKLEYVKAKEKYKRLSAAYNAALTFVKQLEDAEIEAGNEFRRLRSERIERKKGKGIK